MSWYPNPKGMPFYKYFLYAMIFMGLVTIIIGLLWRDWNMVIMGFLTGVNAFALEAAL